MTGGLLEKLVDLWPIWLWVVGFFWWLRKANARSIENTRINNALLEANLEMAKRLRNIEALLERESSP